MQLRQVLRAWPATQAHRSAIQRAARHRGLIGRRSARMGANAGVMAGDQRAGQQHGLWPAINAQGSSVGSSAGDQRAGR
jgi:hypothetical protein